MQCLSRAFLGIPPFSSPQVVLVGGHEETAGCKCRKEKIWLENGKSSSGQGIFKEGGREEEKEQKKEKETAVRH